MRYAAQCAKESGSPVIGTEHLVQGLSMVKEGTAGVVLGEAGVSEPVLREMIGRLTTPETEYIRHSKSPVRKKKKKTDLTTLEEAQGKESSLFRRT